jgi:hypothetical protein
MILPKAIIISLVSRMIMAKATIIFSISTDFLHRIVGKK